VTPTKNEKGISEEAVTEVYRQVLAGEKLESIKTAEEIKDVIRAFSKYSSLSACQISEKTGISTRIIGALRTMSRTHRRRNSQYAEYDRFGIPYAVTQLLKGNNSKYLKLHSVTPETIKKAKKCIKIVESGGTAPELYKLGLSHQQSLKLIELYHRNHAVMCVHMLLTP
jgi:hypothetical protein